MKFFSPLNPLIQIKPVRGAWRLQHLREKYPTKWGGSVLIVHCYVLRKMPECNFSYKGNFFCTCGRDYVHAVHAL